MADTMLKSSSPFNGLTLPRKVGAFDVDEAPPASRYIFRGTPDALGGTFPLPLPDAPCSSMDGGGYAALWLGPDEWLMLAPPGASFAPVRAHGICVDVSHRNCALLIDGPAATQLLAAGCPLDLDLSAFPAGMVTRTLFGKAEIILWRTGPSLFHLECWRSFAPYVAGLLIEASHDVD